MDSLLVFRSLNAPIFDWKLFCDWDWPSFWFWAAGVFRVEGFMRPNDFLDAALAGWFEGSISAFVYARLVFGAIFAFLLSFGTLIWMFGLNFLGCISPGCLISPFLDGSELYFSWSLFSSLLVFSVVLFDFWSVFKFSSVLPSFSTFSTEISCFSFYSYSSLSELTISSLSSGTPPPNIFSANDFPSSSSIYTLYLAAWFFFAGIPLLNLFVLGTASVPVLCLVGTCCNLLYICVDVSFDLLPSPISSVLAFFKFDFLPVTGLWIGFFASSSFFFWSDVFRGLAGPLCEIVFVLLKAGSSFGLVNGFRFGAPRVLLIGLSSSLSASVEACGYLFMF